MNHWTITTRTVSNGVGMSNAVVLVELATRLPTRSMELLRCWPCQLISSIGVSTTSDN